MVKGKMKLLTRESWLSNPNVSANIDLKKEAQLRKESIKFITTLGMDNLRLPLSTVTFTTRPSSNLPPIALLDPEVDCGLPEVLSERFV